MSRKYLNDKYCVRCNRKDVCPYLRDNYDLVVKGREKLSVLDVGCGNGRNSEFMKKKGHNVLSLDMVNDYGAECMLGIDKVPAKSNSIDLILCNYLMMFLSAQQRSQLIGEMCRVGSSSCIIMVELYPAKDSYAKTDADMVKMQKEIFDHIGWNKIRYSKGKFIAQR